MYMQIVLQRVDGTDKETFPLIKNAQIPLRKKINFLWNGSLFTA